MKKNVKEIVSGLKEKGKIFYEKNRILIFFGFGVLIGSGSRLIWNKLNETTEGSVELELSEDGKTMMFHILERNRFKKDICYTLDYDLYSDCQYLQNMNDTLLEALYPGD